MEAVQVHRWTREEYERMAMAGVFHPEARVELVDGAVVEMSPQGSRHATAVQLVETALRDLFDRGYSIRVQMPLALGEASLPEPDVAVVRGTPRDYRDAHPSEAALIVEVADTSLAFDRGPKLAVYAGGGVPEYWVVDLVETCVEVYRDPAGAAYRSKATYDAAGTLAPVARPDAAISVADLLP